MNKQSRIYIAGHSGLIGTVLMRQLKVKGYMDLITASSDTLDLTDKGSTYSFFEKERPEIVYFAAAHKGG